MVGSRWVWNDVGVERRAESLRRVTRAAGKSPRLLTEWLTGSRFLWDRDLKVFGYEVYQWSVKGFQLVPSNPFEESERR